MAAIQQTFAFAQPEQAKSRPAQQPAQTLRSSISQAPQLPPTPAPDPHDRAAAVRHLRAQVGCISTAPADHWPRSSTGCAAIDAMLPSGGLKTDAITEWVGQSDSSGATALSLIAAATHLRCQDVTGPILVIDTDKTFYPPAAVALGIPMERMILVHPANHTQLVWSIDQALRCEAVGAVWARVGKRLDDRDARRFQLSAETAGTPGFLVRDSAARGRPSFADVRFHVAGISQSEPTALAAGVPLAPPVKNVDGTALAERVAHQESNEESLAHAAGYQTRQQPHSSARLLHVTLDRCRGGVIGQNVYVQIDDHAEIHHVSFNKSVRHETAAVHLAAQLAHPKAPQSTDHRKRRA